MVNDSHQFSSLINAIGESCDNKDVDMVIVALAISIANVGISQEIPYEKFLEKVLKVITSVYVIDEIGIDGDGSIH
jgi:hypothetical protein